nr:immunoglobulin light chain junction region [Macaca mulatta]MOX51918.1 immunoglobulin light chain junction region [Macaca mulatta]MOX52076.1 immunoglobulin light chain junction region [Macaca mulatta]MOX53079.1 immunoglobulin light chain junction region [Macaca mulatta]MOX53764.1 immunoglobulin light chain junction region [Macaca mulatta]
CLQSSYWPFTF